MTEAMTAKFPRGIRTYARKASLLQRPSAWIVEPRSAAVVAGNCGTNNWQSAGQGRGERPVLVQ